MGRRILAVDDNPIVGLTLSARLWAAGYEVTVAPCAEVAFKTLSEQRFDLVLLDLEMPGIDGFKALSIIKQCDMCPGVPVVLLTSSDEILNVVQARELGAQGYLTKEHAVEALIRSVERLVTAPETIWLDDHHCVSTLTPPVERLSA